MFRVFFQVDSEVCSLNSDQTNELLSPLEEVLTNITAEEGALDRIVEIIKAIDRSGIIPALQDTATFVAEIADIIGTSTAGDASWDDATADVICELALLYFPCFSLRKIR